jgi:hypothetical protein
MAQEIAYVLKECLDQLGNTPNVVRICTKCEHLCQSEHLNPGGSIKDRVALSCSKRRKKGKLKSGDFHRGTHNRKPHPHRLEVGIWATGGYCHARKHERGAKKIIRRWGRRSFSPCETECGGSHLRGQRTPEAGRDVFIRSIRNPDNPLCHY